MIVRRASISDQYMTSGITFLEHSTTMVLNGNWDENFLPWCCCCYFTSFI